MIAYQPGGFKKIPVLKQFPESIIMRLERARVAAGFSVERVEQAVPMAKALLAGGIDVMELLLLRTPAAMVR